MKEKRIKIFAMRCEEGKVYKGRIEEMENSLEAKQRFVDGHIQVVGLTDEIDLVLNDEGKLDSLPLNRVWLGKDGNILDILVGNVLACRFDSEGDFTSILESDIPVILERLPAVMAVLGRNVLVRNEDDLPEYG
jgi:hypothetical protein